MRELGSQNKINLKIYYICISVVNLFMIFGLITTFLRHEYWLKLTIQSIFVFVIFSCTLCYPFKENNKLRVVLMFSGTIYFYVLFLLYPATTSIVALIFFSPVISIIFFEEKVFKTILMFNFFLGTALFIGLKITPYGKLYPSITGDLVGNLINFFVSQAIIYLIFGFTAQRMDMIAKYYEKVKHAERLNTVGQLSASIAHEIRNPLTVVKGFLQFYGDGDISKNHKKLMLDELERAEAIIRDYLSLSKPHNEDSVITDIGQEIRAVTDVISPFALINKNTIEVITKDGLWVNIPSFDIRQVLTNVIKNAVEAMCGKSGIITVKGYQSEKYVIVEIIDTGVGLTKQELKAIGTPFYSLKQQGTGIGLTVCFSIIEKYKGHITVESEKSIGTNVKILLPSIK